MNFEKTFLHKNEKKEEKEKHQADSILENIAAQENNKYSDMAKCLLEKFDLSFPVIYDTRAVNDDGSEAFYKNRTGEIFLKDYFKRDKSDYSYKDNSYGYDNTSIHEVIHALTVPVHMREETNKSELFSTFENVYKKAQEYRNELTHTYPMSDAHEFIVGLYVDAPMIKLLNQKESIGEQISNDAIPELSDVIEKTFDVEIDKNSLYFQAKSIADLFFRGSSEFHPYLAMLEEQMKPDIELIEKLRNKKIPSKEAYENYLSMRKEKVDLIRSMTLTKDQILETVKEWNNQVKNFLLPSDWQIRFSIDTFEVSRAEDEELKKVVEHYITHHRGTDIEMHYDGMERSQAFIDEKQQEINDWKSDYHENKKNRV